MKSKIEIGYKPNATDSMGEGINLIEDGIQARYVSPMHYPYRYPPASVEESFPNAVGFKDTLEGWVVPIE